MIAKKLLPKRMVITTGARTGWRVGGRDMKRQHGISCSMCHPSFSSSSGVCSCCNHGLSPKMIMEMKRQLIICPYLIIPRPSFRSATWSVGLWLARSLSLTRSLLRSLGCLVARSIVRSVARSISRLLARSLARSVARIAQSLSRSLARSLARSVDTVEYY